MASWWIDMKKLLASFLACSFISGCSSIPPEAYTTPGKPESLLDVSSEIVNLNIDSGFAVDELTHWINQDQPSRAEIYCMEGTPSCQHTLDVVDLYGVPYQLVPSQDNMITLVYERVLARDCDNRFIDNTVNPYNLHHPAFGCSIAVNTVQMATDKQQFVRPNIMDLPDAKKSTQAYYNYQTRREVEQQEGISDSLLDQISQ